MKHKTLPPLELLQELFSYEPTTGVLVWKSPRSYKLKSGQIAGNLDKGGRRVVSINHQTFFVARIIWKMVTGTDPNEMVVDHINGIPSDNRLENLRLATYRQNNQNCRKKSDNGLPKGVHAPAQLRGFRNPYRVLISIDGKVTNLGHYPTVEIAHSVYIEAAKKFHKNFARFN